MTHRTVSWLLLWRCFGLDEGRSLDPPIGVAKEEPGINDCGNKRGDERGVVAGRGGLLHAPSGAGLFWPRSALGVVLLSLFLAMALFSVLGGVSGAVVRVSAPPTVDKGTTFSVSIRVDSVTDLYGAQFSLSFNPSVLAAQSVSEGSFLKEGGASTFFNAPTIDNSLGTITGAAITRLGVPSGATGSGTLATISFRAKSTGTSSLTLSNVALSDSNAQPISFTKQDGSVLVRTPQPPDTQITSGPTGTISTTSTTFTWSGTDPDGYVVSYYYKLDNGAWTYTTQTSKTFTGLSKGDHTFQVKARDNDGLVDPTPAQRSFKVYYTSEPDTQITSGPSGTIEGSEATFTWTGTDIDGYVVSYYYKLDNGTWVETTNTTQTFTNLSYTNHTFLVKARDNDGLVDPTPAQRNFTLKPYWWEVEIDRLRTTIQELQDRVQNLTQRNQELENNNTQLEAVVEGLEEERQELVEEADSLSTQLEALRQDLTATQRERDQLQSQLTELESLYTLLNQTRQSLEEENKGLREQNRALQGDNRELRGQIANLTAENQGLREELKHLRELVDQLEETIAKLQGQLPEMGGTAALLLVAVLLGRATRQRKKKQEPTL